MSTQGFERWLTQFCDAFYGNLGGNLLGFFVGNFILSGRSREKINLSKVFCKACFVYLLMAIMTATVRLNTMEEQQRHLRLEKAAGLS